MVAFLLMLTLSTLSQTTGMSPLPAAPRAGTNATITRGPGGGFSVSLGQQREWQHPWQTKLWWLGDLKQWVATVRPGFVNGRAPVVRTSAELAKSLAGRFYNGLITSRSGAADIARAAELAREGVAGLVADAVKLTDNPPITLPFRRLGFDSGGGNGTAVPSFFRKLGVQESQPGDPNNPAALKQAKKGNRLLVAADIIVHQPRQALTSTVTFGPGLATGVSNVTQTLGVRSAVPGDRLSVHATALWDSSDPSRINPLAGDYEEPPYDERPVATVFLVSPPDAAAGSLPDGKWVPYVKHSLFWNLTHLAKTSLEVPQLDNAVGRLLSSVGLLGGGVASFAVILLIASLNDLTQNALNLITGHSMAGTWWTATGGGSDSEFPEEPAPAAAPGGWDKSARLQAARSAAARALKAARLDPPFPFRAVAFTHSLLTQ